MEFGFESLRDLPDLDALKDAGLLSCGAPIGDEGAEASKASTVEGQQLPEASRVGFA